MTNLKKCFYSQFIWSFNAFKHLLRFCFALSVLGSQSQPAGSQSLWEDGQIRGRSARLKVQSTLRVHMPQGTCPREHWHVAVRLTDLWAARSPDSRERSHLCLLPKPILIYRALGLRNLPFAPLPVLGACFPQQRLSFPQYWSLRV